MDQQYMLEISRFKCNAANTDMDKLLSHQPTTLLQLNIWCQLMFVAKIQLEDVPDNGVFYLHDRAYEQLTCRLPETEKNRIIYKIQMLSHVLGMSGATNIGISRELEECLMIAVFGKKTAKQAVQSYLQIRTSFFSAHALQLLAEWIVKFTPVSRNLGSLDTITLINIVMNRLSTFPTESEAIQNFIVSQSKKALCASLKDYIVKSKDYHLIQFLLLVTSKLSIQNELFRGAITCQNQSEVFYQAYYSAKQAGRLHKCKNLQNFMLKNSAIQGLTLHQTLYHQPEVSANELATLTIPELISSKNPKIYCKIKHSPVFHTYQCLSLYLKKSQFNIPEPNHQRAVYNRQNVQLSPLSFMAIHKHFWEDVFHKDVLNLCLWIITDHWLLQAESMITSRVDLEDYKRNLCLGILIFMMGNPLGSFVSYYPSQKNLLADLFNLPNFATLVVKSPRFLEIPWFVFVINSELKTVIKQENGYELAYKILTNKGTSFEQHFGTYLLNTIEAELQRAKHPNWHKDKKYILKILEEYRQGKLYKERAQSLKVAVENRF